MEKILNKKALLLLIALFYYSNSHAAEDKITCNGYAGFDQCASHFRDLSPKWHTFNFQAYTVTFPVDGSNTLHWQGGGSSGDLYLDLLKGETLWRTSGNVIYACLVAKAAFPGGPYENTVRVAVTGYVSTNTIVRTICLNGVCDSDGSGYYWGSMPQFCSNYGGLN